MGSPPKVGQWVICRFQGVERRAQITEVFDPEVVGLAIYVKTASGDNNVECGRPRVLYAATEIDRAIDDRWWHPGPKEFVQELRERLTADDVRVIEKVWAEFKRIGEWPTLKVIEVACFKERIAFHPRLPFVHAPSGDRARLVLSLAGFRFVSGATKEAEWVTSVLRALAERYVVDPDRGEIGATDLQAVSSLSADVIEWVAGFLLNNEPRADRDEHRTWFLLDADLLAAAEATSLDDIIYGQATRARVDAKSRGRDDQANGTTPGVVHHNYVNHGVANAMGPNAVAIGNTNNTTITQPTPTNDPTAGKRSAPSGTTTIVLSLLALAVAASGVYVSSRQRDVAARTAEVPLPGVAFDAPRFGLETRFSWPVPPGGLLADDVKHLARNILSITNTNDIDLQRLEARLQLPEPIVQRPNVRLNYAGGDLRFRAVSATMEMSAVGSGAGVRYIDRNTGAEVRYDGMGSGNAALAETEPLAGLGYGGVDMLTVGTPGNTGVWELRVAELPAGKQITLELITSDDAATADYRELAKGCRDQGGRTRCFLSGEFAYKDGSRVVRREFFMPITFDASTRTASFAEPNTKRTGIKLDYGVPFVPIAEAGSPR
jgi:hypothetical protein|nr:hypothetical protein [Kofleriaceae bacterium]